MIHLQQVSKLYRTERVETTALDNINLEIGKGEFISVMGPSGCGKSTLLNLMGLLDEPSSGSVALDGKACDRYGDRALSRVRRIPTWEQPSAPCLSSRIPYGTPVTPARLRVIEAAEAALRALGVAGDLRVRYHGDLARVELTPLELERWLEPRGAAALRDAVHGAGFARVALDLRCFRSGSLNVLGGLVADAEPAPLGAGWTAAEPAA